MNRDTRLEKLVGLATMPLTDEEIEEDRDLALRGRVDEEVGPNFTLCQLSRYIATIDQLKEIISDSKVSTTQRPKKV